MVVTGGVLSGIGKGVTASSIGVVSSRQQSRPCFTQCTSPELKIHS